MIDRYSREKMRVVWTLKNKFQKWLDIELAVCYAHYKNGDIPKQDYDRIVKKAGFNVERIELIEAEVHHDVIAFLTSMAETIDSNSSRFVHLGLTSSDVVDTGFSLLVQEAGHLLKSDLKELMQVIRKQAFRYKLIPMMGRTHGVHAEPLTFGLKLTIWYEELKRSAQRLDDACEILRVGKISGAVGNYAHLSPKIEKTVCRQLKLEASRASTQILQRDRHAQFMTTLAIIGGTLEKIATEIRALQKTEFNEVLEPFSKKQKGSSAMPHKRNPIICERVAGLSRLIRGYALTAMENQCLWHERDISHSSTERIIFPDATIALDYMVSLMIKTLKDLDVNELQMKSNILKSYNVFYSQQILLKLVEKGLLREEAYRIVQKNAMAAFEQKINFDIKIREDSRIKDLFTQKELEAVFNLDCYLKNIDYIYKRVY